MSPLKRVNQTLVTPTLVGRTRVYRTQDGRILSREHLEARPDRFRVGLELEASRRLAISA
jgi:hypothetical protein